MNISELVQQLEQIKIKHGDLDVVLEVDCFVENVTSCEMVEDPIMGYKQVTLASDN